MNVSVVVPTFNRGLALNSTLSALLNTEARAGESMEVIVVDDGSGTPAQQTARGSLVQSALELGRLRFVRQQNAGPAAARNTGFRESSGAIVLFVDDDILVPPGLVAAHLDAHHLHPGSVIFGLCPFAPGPPTPFRRFLARYVSGGEGAPDFVESSLAASGQLSIERKLFAADAGVYASGLSTPAAEEYELSWRLQHRGVPILCANRILALHDQPVDLETYCRQQYKHGMGAAEVAAKMPDALEFRALGAVFRSNHPQAGLAGLKPRALAKSLLSHSLGRRSLLQLARLTERYCPYDAIDSKAYELAVSAYFVGGVRDGIIRFADDRTAHA